MTTKTQKPNHLRRRHAQIHFPPLDASEALLVVNLFEKAITAIWRAHGDDMADYLGRVDPDSEMMQEPYDAESSFDTQADVDVEYPF